MSIEDEVNMLRGSMISKALQAMARGYESALQPLIDEFQKHEAEWRRNAGTASQTASAQLAHAFQSDARWKEFAEQGAAFREYAAEFWAAASSMARALEKLPAQTRTTVRTLANNGWYVNPSFYDEDVAGAIERFEEGRAAEANDYMCEYVTAHLEKIEETICDGFPQRERIIRQAFSAHRRGEHALSIPVFLAQADGICAELKGEQLYRRRGDGTPRLNEVIRPDPRETLESAYLLAVLESFPIADGPKQRAGVVGHLNRHAVLHGESHDYDTPLNSCRSLTLLGYVGWILK